MTPKTRVRRALFRTWPLLAALALLAGMPFLLWQCRESRVAVKSTIYLPEMLAPLPVRPIELISDAPIKERVTIEYESRDGPRRVEADLYRPRDATDAPGVVFSMGAPPLDLDDDNLTRISDVIARAGVVLLVPFSDRLDEERIEPEEIDALVAQFRYVQELPGVDPSRVGFFGASVGGSLALVAAADERINDEVAYVVSFGGYFDAIETFAAVITGQIAFNGVDEAWEPRLHAKDVVAQQIINRVGTSRDRDVLYRLFVDREAVPDGEIAMLSDEGRVAYEVLSSSEPREAIAAMSRLPADALAELEYLSPHTHVHALQAELFILHDQADEFIPYTELRRFRDAVGDRPDTHFDETRIFEHVEPRLGQRPDRLIFDMARVLYRMYQLLLLWE